METALWRAPWIAIAIMGCLPAAAETQWREIVRTSGQVLLLDEGSNRPSGSYRQAWTMGVYLVPRVHDGKSYLSSKTLHVVDCGGSRIAMKQLHYYPLPSGQGRPTFSLQAERPEWLDPAPESVAAAVVAAVCKQ